MRVARFAVSFVLIAAGTASTAGAPTRAPRPRAPTAEPPVLSGLAFPTPAAGWVLASHGVGDGEVLATRDAGASWSVQWTGAVVPQQVLATDPEHAWVLGQPCALCGSTLLGTSNGGGSWAVLARLPVRVNQIAFASPAVGLAAARKESCRDRAAGPPPLCPGWVLATADGGRTWRPVMKSAEPIVAVAAGQGRLWALDAAPESRRPGSGGHPASLVVFSSGDRGRSWHVRGVVHPPMIAGLDVEAQLLPRTGGRLWLSAFDQESCAMHGCGLDDVWSSGDGGRRWSEPRFRDDFERPIGAPCAAAGPISLARANAAISFNLQDCAGPLSALYRLGGSQPTLVHVWRSFAPVALAWPAPSIGYALDQAAVERSTDGGRTWTQVFPAAARVCLTRHCPPAAGPVAFQDAPGVRDAPHPADGVGGWRVMHTGASGERPSRREVRVGPHSAEPPPASPASP